MRDTEILEKSKDDSQETPEQRAVSEELKRVGKQIESSPIPEKETNFQKRVLDYIEPLMGHGEEKSLDAERLAVSLTGLDSDRAWKMRGELFRGLLKEEFGRGDCAEFYLIGLDSDRAWQMREQFLKEGVNTNSIATSLVGLDSDRAWKMRGELLEQGAYKGSVAVGLAGLNSDRAWEIRDEFMRDLLRWGEMQGLSRRDLADSLTGLDSDRAWQTRDDLLKLTEEEPYKSFDKEDLVRSLAGLNSDRAWQMRDELMELATNKDKLAEGLSGLDPEAKAWQLKFKIEAYRSSLIDSLTGLDSDRAWQMREQLLEQGAHKESIAVGLAGLNSDRAWQMREQLLEQGVDKTIVTMGLYGNGLMVAVCKAREDQEEKRFAEFFIAERRKWVGGLKRRKKQK